MKFPDISVIPPVLGNGQYSYGGVLLGSGQTWAVLSADGLDLPKVRSADEDRPLDDGEFEGLDYLSGRDITLDLHSQFSSNAAMRSNLSALEAVMGPPDDAVTEVPLWFQRSGLPLLVAQVRPRQFRLKSEAKLSSRHTAQPVVLLHATSSYVYGPTQSGLIQVPGVPAGFAFNAHFNLSFGGGGSVGVLTVTNPGTAPARACYLFTGPINTPTILNGSLTGNPQMTFNLNMGAGDLLFVDTDLDSPSAVFFAAGSNSGSSRLTALQPGSTPFWLQTGTNKLVFSSLDSAPTEGSCEVIWAPPYKIGL